MRKPRIENKYNLTMSDVKHLAVNDRSKISGSLFWRNNVISAWCISGETSAKCFKRGDFAKWVDIQLLNDGMQDEFWIGIYDDNAKAYAGKVRVSFSSYGGMCGYEFKRFYDEKDIENEQDLVVQEMFMKTINQLLDEGILIVKE